MPTAGPNDISKTIDSTSEPPVADGGIDGIETSTTQAIIIVASSNSSTTTFSVIEFVMAIIITAIVVMMISIIVYCITHRNKQQNNDEEVMIDNSRDIDGMTTSEINTNKTAEMMRIGSVSSTKTGGNIIEKTAVEIAMMGSVSPIQLDGRNPAQNHDIGRNDEIDDIRNNDNNLGEDAIADDLVEELNQTAGQDFELNATIEDPNVQTAGGEDNVVAQINKTHGNDQADLDVTIDENIDTTGFLQ